MTEQNGPEKFGADLDEIGKWVVTEARKRREGGENFTGKFKERTGIKTDEAAGTYISETRQLMPTRIQTWLRNRDTKRGREKAKIHLQRLSILFEMLGVPKGDPEDEKVSVIRKYVGDDFKYPPEDTGADDS